MKTNTIRSYSKHCFLPYGKHKQAIVYTYLTRMLLIMTLQIDITAIRNNGIISLKMPSFICDLMHILSKVVVWFTDIPYKKYAIDMNIPVLLQVSSINFFREWVSNNLAMDQQTADLNSSPQGQNGRLFADDIFRCIFVNEIFQLRLKFHWSLFPRVQLTIIHHCFK